MLLHKGNILNKDIQTAQAYQSVDLRAAARTRETNELRTDILAAGGSAPTSGLSTVKGAKSIKNPALSMH